MKKLLVLLAACMLLLLTACGESAAPSPAGTWAFSPSVKDDEGIISETICLDENGMGYLCVQKQVQDESINYYYPLFWEDTSILVRVDRVSESWEFSLGKNSMTVNRDDGSAVFTRAGKTEKRTPLKSGKYTLVNAILGGKERTQEVINTTVTINPDRTGYSQNGDYSADFVWDAYFITFETGDPYFYTFDGKILTEYRSDTQLTFELSE